VFEAWKGRKNIKEPKHRRLEPKAEVAKIESFGLVFQVVWFFLNR
jgi:hypothetical protein